MTETDPLVRLPLSDREYSLLDTASKLLGLGLVAVGLDVGGGTAAGLALAVAGAVCATATVFVTNE
ncbi:hypothetical protein [Haloplanus pelagicus]|jgi:hypothetical protein|uniref:hypothetical protein n=1 Tax=Haloplanus pelagicus TaxID=2949995 RepID=UPI00203E10F1|nr:hypothetical protein [Haloplanus sp. HW8-1]